MLKTILIVDDDQALADNLNDILSDEGYQLFSAANCADALALADEKNPHVALLDLKLPDDTGINLLIQLKENHPDCICTLMTAFADVDSAVTALAQGAFHYLQKPVRPIELINLLARIFEIIEIRDQKRLAEEKLRESEKRFRTLFESAQDAIYIKDTNSNYTLVNPSMERLFGLNAKDFIGRTDKQIFNSEMWEETRKVENHVLKGEIVEAEKVHWIKQTKRTFHSIKVPLISPTGEITGLCGFERDLTSTKQLEAQLLQAQKMEAVGILAGGISHDFNNLLQGILGYTQILLSKKETGDADYEKLKEIERAGQRASDLTKQLLAFGRKVELNPRPLDIHQVIKQVAKLLQRTIPKMIHIDMELADPIFTVNADPGQLEQVLLNIGVNAKDAMPDGGRLLFKTENVDPDATFRKVNLGDDIRPYICLSITDTGSGMPDDIIEHIFEPFFTTKRTGQGTGLGLAMAYGIIKNHGGHLACHSAPRKGTTFMVYLPAIDATVQAEMEDPPIPIVRGEGETILVIDDEAFLRDLAKDMLTMNGYQVITAVSGEEGLEQYQKHHTSITLIILDLIMPGMGGKQCLTEILKIDPAAKILISSGYTLDEPNKDQTLMKANGFIHKPYNFRQMLKTIRQVISL